MILFIEQILIHGAFIFMNLIQGLYELSAYLFCDQSTNEKQSNSNDVTDVVNSSEDCMQLWGLPVLNNEVSQQEEYILTSLTDDQSAYFTSLIACISVTEEEVKEEVKEEVQIESEDCILTMESWQEQPEPVAVSPILASTANAKIDETLIGEQLWVVEVIGVEQEYIHVSDGSGRAWIDTNNFGPLGKNDILSILVHRFSDLRVDLLAVDVLQSHSSEFSILDEYYNYNTDDYNKQDFIISA